MHILAKRPCLRNGRSAVALCAVTLFAVASSGCQASYVARMAVEQVRYLAGARPLAELIDEAGDGERRRRLELVLDVRAFAERSGLDVGGSYREVADTDSAAPFHVVTAAHADRLEAYTWWYPVVGRMPYRGYFDAPSAERFAEGLRDRGLDTLIVRASAYSTLGWFDDPLPSGLLENDDVEIATVILHELTHQTLFVRGSVAFNETLANSVALRLAVKLFDERGDSVRRKTAEERLAAWVERGRIFDELAASLEGYFDSARERGLPRDALLAGRAEIYADAQARLARGRPEGGALGAGELDNARFLAAYRYARRAPEVDRFVAAHGVVGALDLLERSLGRGVDPYEWLAGRAQAGPGLLNSPKP